MQLCITCSLLRAETEERIEFGHDSKSRLDTTDNRLEKRHRWLKTTDNRLEKRHRWLNTTDNRLEHRHNRLQQRHRRLDTRHSNVYRG
jgi:uncharacterized protein (DUF3084 family)